MARRPPDLTGLRIGKLEVLRRIVAGPGPAKWECQCDCGVLATVTHNSLMKGCTRSCGCLRREMLRRERGGPVAQRFEKYVMPEPNSGCHIWIGNRPDGRYGRFWVAGNGLLAHRAAWQLFRGPIPDGLAVLHRCDNPPCVNPGHLFLGTFQDNSDDMLSKGRSAWGDRCWKARIDMEDAAGVIAMYEAGGSRQSDIAARFGLTQSTVSKIIRGDTWRGLQRADHARVATHSH